MTNPTAGRYAAMAHVREVLADARRRWFLKEWLRIATEAAIVAVVALGGSWFVTKLVPATPATLVALLAAVLAVVIAFLGWRAGTLWRRPTDHQVARYVEERVPELDEALVSALQCEREERPSLMAVLVVDDAATRMRAVDLDRIVPRRELWLRGVQLLTAVAVLVAAIVALHAPILQTMDILRMAIAPPVITIEVTPGDVQIRQGTDFRVRARAVGVPSRLPRQSLRVSLDLPEGTQPRSMAPNGAWDEYSLEQPAHDFTYRVSGYGVTSRAYRVEVRPRPRVARIDLHYEFPSFSGLRPRTDEDTGDIYAPVGTKVRLVVHTTVPVAGGEVGLTSGTKVSLAPSPARTLEARFTVTRDDSYRLGLLEADGARTADDTEYFVRTVDDRPPDVRILRPAGDRRVTRLEEVVIEARADDDYGVDRLELVYAARGGEEHVVRLGSATGTSMTGRHTLFVEDLDVQPGDFVSYYARARDIAHGKRPSESRSDIFFLEVRPFNEEFQAAQSQAMRGAAGGSFDDLAARQKEIIIATWKLERRSGAGRSTDDIRALGRAQGELKGRAEQLAARLAAPRPSGRGRGAQVSPIAPPAPRSDDPMRKAVEAMGKSQSALEALQTAQAIPHEMEALNQLLKAQADIQRRTVTQQQSAGGGGGQTGNQDLSGLFDRELQRQQKNSYESRSSVEQPDRGKQQSDAMEKLRELARRQDDLSRRQQELDRLRARLAQDEIKRQLERLSREQEELRRQAEQLAAEMRQQGDQAGGRPGSQGDSRSMQEAAEAMRQSAGGLQRDEVAEAAAQAQRAAERLREAERAAEGKQPGAADRAAGDLQLGAAQLADSERRLARRLRESEGANPDALRQLAGEQDRAAEGAARLGQAARALADSSSGRDGTARNASRDQAARALANGEVEKQLRESARGLRTLSERAAEGGPSGPQRATQGERQREAQRAENIARTLEGVSQGLGDRSGKPGDRGQLSEQLARAGELRDRLGELSRRLREGTAPQGPPRGSADRDGAQQRSGGQGQGREAAGTPSPSSDARGNSSSPQGQSGGQGGGSAEGRPTADEIARELRSLRRLAEGLGQDGEGVRRALQTFEGWTPTPAAPGTEAFKQDYSKWESLRQGVGVSLEALEAKLSAKLQEQQEGRLDAGASESAPDAYRRDVARYYRFLARKPQS